MKYLLTLFTSLIAFASVRTAMAATDPGQLVRSPEQSAVYYVLNDHRRFAFPNDAIFRSWFVNFNSVHVAPASTVAQSWLAGVVLYHPGKLVKITTDPRVYLVTFNGELRWIETETVARALFGNNWASQVNDLSDAFFSAYRIGTPIHTTQDIDLVSLMRDTLTRSIADNQLLFDSVDPLVVPPTSTTPTLPVTPSSTESNIVVRTNVPNGVRVNESANIDVFATQTIPERVDIRINGAPARSCLGSVSCSYSFQHPSQTGITSYHVQVQASFRNGLQRTQELDIPVRDLAAGALRLRLSQTESRSPGNVDIEAEWNDVIVGAREIDLIIDGQQQKTCFNATRCTLSYPVVGAVSSTMIVQASAEDTSGHVWMTPTSTVNIVNNERPTVTTGINAATIFTGETIQVNVQAADQDAIAFIEIWENNERVARCEQPSCSYTSSPIRDSGIKRYRVVGQDLLGARREVELEPVMVLPALR